MSPQFNQPLPAQMNQQPKPNIDNDQYKSPYNPFPVWPYEQDSSNNEKKINQQQKFQSTFPLNYPIQPQPQPEKVSKQ